MTAALSTSSVDDVERSLQPQALDHRRCPGSRSAPANPPSAPCGPAGRARPAPASGSPGRSARTLSIRSSSASSAAIGNARRPGFVVRAWRGSEMSEPPSLGTHAHGCARKSIGQPRTARGCPRPGSGAAAAAPTSRPAPRRAPGKAAPGAAPGGRPSRSRPDRDGPAAGARAAGASSASSAERSQSGQRVAARSAQRPAVPGQHRRLDRAAGAGPAPRRAGRTSNGVPVMPCRQSTPRPSPSIDRGDLSPVPGRKRANMKKNETGPRRPRLVVMVMPDGGRLGC